MAIRYLDEKPKEVGSKIRFVDEVQEPKKQDEKVSVVGKIFNVPSAVNRETIRKNPIMAVAGPFTNIFSITGLAGKDVQKTAIEAAKNPSTSETFQDEAIRNAQSAVATKWGKRTGIFAPSTKLGRILMGAELIAEGHRASQLGYIQDFATNPADVLLSLGDIVTSVKGVFSKVKDFSVNKDAIRMYKQVAKPSTKISSVKSLETSNNKIADGLKAIVENQDNIKYIDETTGLPDTVEKTVYAANKTKEEIFKEYSNLRKMAGEDASVDMMSVAQKVFESKASKAAGIANPKLQQDAFEMANELSKAGKIDLETAEETIRLWNAELEPIYRAGKGTGEEVVKAQLKATAANALRTELDNIILKETGKAYQPLKNVYGSLVEIEQNYIKKLEQMQRATPKKGGEVLDTVPILYGAFTGNVPLVTAGITQKLIKSAISIGKHPDIITSKMFKLIDKSRNVPINLKGSTTVSGRKIQESLNKRKINERNLNQ